VVRLRMDFGGRTRRRYPGAPERAKALMKGRTGGKLPSGEFRGAVACSQAVRGVSKRRQEQTACLVDR
jgi:hypothetical protein